MSAKPEVVDAGDGAKPAKSKKMLIIILGAVLVLALGGGGAFFYISKQRADAAAAEEAEDVGLRKIGRQGRAQSRASLPAVGQHGRQFGGSWW